MKMCLIPAVKLTRTVSVKPGQIRPIACVMPASVLPIVPRPPVHIP